MTHPWLLQRPISAWIPAGLSETNLANSRQERPVLHPEACTQCNICWLVCPEGVIERGDPYSIQYNFCRGCGLCAVECPKEAIEMKMEIHSAD